MGNQEQIVFQIILHGGNSRSLAMEALADAKKKDFLAAREKLKQASAEINKAHHIQTNLIQSEAAGVKTEVSLLLVHAQDHLMNAITVKDLAAEFVDLYESI